RKSLRAHGASGPLSSCHRTRGVCDALQRSRAARDGFRRRADAARGRLQHEIRRFGRGDLFVGQVPRRSGPGDRLRKRNAFEPRRPAQSDRSPVPRPDDAARRSRGVRPDRRDLRRVASRNEPRDRRVRRDGAVAERDRRQTSRARLLTEWPAVLAAVALLSAVTIVLASVFVAIGSRARLRRFAGRTLVVTGLATPDGHWKELFSVLPGLLRTCLARWRDGQPPIGFEIVGRASEVRFRVWIASRDERHLRAALRGAYPGA